jgi:hypothetical protein
MVQHYSYNNTDSPSNVYHTVPHCNSPASQTSTQGNQAHPVPCSSTLVYSHPVLHYDHHKPQQLWLVMPHLCLTCMLWSHQRAAAEWRSIHQPADCSWHVKYCYSIAAAQSDLSHHSCRWIIIHQQHMHAACGQPACDCAAHMQQPAGHQLVLHPALATPPAGHPRWPRDRCRAALSAQAAPWGSMSTSGQSCTWSTT